MNDTTSQGLTKILNHCRARELTSRKVQQGATSGVCHTCGKTPETYTYYRFEDYLYRSSAILFCQDHAELYDSQGHVAANADISVDMCVLEDDMFVSNSPEMYIRWRRSPVVTSVITYKIYHNYRKFTVPRKITEVVLTSPTCDKESILTLLTDLRDRLPQMVALPLNVDGMEQGVWIRLIDEAFTGLDVKVRLLADRDEWLYIK